VEFHKCGVRKKKVTQHRAYAAIHENRGISE
jgi:hypothetical protein